MNAAILRSLYVPQYQSPSIEAPGLLQLAMRFKSVIGSAFLTSATTVFMLKLPVTIKLPATGPYLTYNESASSFNTSSNSFPPIHCDGSRFGINLRVDSCKDALRYLPKASSTESLVFGNRQWGSYDVVVPNRYLSCKLSPRYFSNTCFI